MAYYRNRESGYVQRYVSVLGPKEMINQASSPTASKPKVGKTPARTIDRQPSCFIVGQDSKSVQLALSVIGDFGIRLQGFDDVANMLDAARHRRPDVVFIDLDPFGSGAS